MKKSTFFYWVYVVYMAVFIAVTLFGAFVVNPLAMSFGATRAMPADLLFEIAATFSVFIGTILFIQQYRYIYMEKD